MEEAVNAIQGEFGCHIMVEFLRPFRCDCCADEDFPVRKRDHVGGAPDAEKLAVDPGYGAGTDHRELNVMEAPERSA
jgi:hypothetical protein